MNKWRKETAMVLNGNFFAIIISEQKLKGWREIKCQVKWNDGKRSRRFAEFVTSGKREEFDLATLPLNPVSCSSINYSVLILYPLFSEPFPSTKNFHSFFPFICSCERSAVTLFITAISVKRLSLSSGEKTSHEFDGRRRE